MSKMAKTPVEGYKVNYASKTLTITKEFEALSQDPLSTQAQVIKAFREMFPDLRIVRKSHRPSKRVNPDAGLTYPKMEKYIRLHENSGELLRMFETVKDIATTQKNPYLYTKTWFFQQFPNFYDMPVFDGGKLYILPVRPPEADNPKEEEKIEQNKVVNL